MYRGLPRCHRTRLESAGDSWTARERDLLEREGWPRKIPYRAGAAWESDRPGPGEGFEPRQREAETHEWTTAVLAAIPRGAGRARRRDRHCAPPSGKRRGR